MSIAHDTHVLEPAVGSRPASPAEAKAATGLAEMAQVVLEDHAELDESVELLKELRAALCRNDAHSGAASAELIEQFAVLLIPHFAAEEVEEFFGSFLANEPGLLQRVERLQGEHAELLESLDRLVRFVKGGAPPLEVAARLGQFLDRFETHEQQENAIMKELLLLDDAASA